LPALTCLTGLDSRRVYPLGFETITIGRSLGVEIRIRDRAPFPGDMLG
jgi:hypothetical protein